MMTVNARAGLAGAVMILALATGDYRGVLSAEAQAAERVDVIVDFEHLPDGSPTSAGPIGDDYAEWGIHFRSIGVDLSKSPTYCSTSPGDTYAYAGTCSYPTGFNIVASFDMPVYAVSAYVDAATGETVKMVAKDANGVILDSVVSPPVPKAAAFVGPVELTSDTPIASVEWWPSSVTSGVAVDDLKIVVDEVGPSGTKGGTDGPGFLAAYWNFNEGQGSVAHDLSRRGNDAGLHGPVSWAAGHEGTALSFTGVGNYLLVENSPELNAAGAITIAAWINPTWTANNRVLQKGTNDNQYRLLKENGDNFVFDLAGVANGRLEHDKLPAPLEWTHVAATYDGSAMRLYYNATLVATHPASGLIHTTTDPLCIGSKRAGAPSSDEYSGLIDELRIYNRALTAGKVKALFDWPADCNLRVTDVRIIPGESVDGKFQAGAEVNNVTVGDLFQVRVEVTNMGAVKQTVLSLYGWTLSGDGQAQVVGYPCVGVYPISLDPGESAILNAFCPASQAFGATQAGWATMDITVGACHETARFEIVQAKTCPVEITDVHIIRLQPAGSFFQEVGEVDEVTDGDHFTVKIQVTNRGKNPIAMPNVYRWDWSGPGGAEVVGNPPCTCLARLELQPGESATLIPFCGCFALEATKPGTVTMDITLGNDCHDTITFDIVPKL